MTHVIRLRGPWELEVLERFNDAFGALTETSPTRVPGDWSVELEADFIGRVRYTRRFNKPTNLGPDERVWLVVEAVDHQGRIALNGKPLAEMSGAQSCRLDITPLLHLHNELEIEVALPADVYHDPAARGERAGCSGGLIGEVRLEIQSSGE